LFSEGRLDEWQRYGVEMQITLAHIGGKGGKAGPKSNYEALTRLYVERIGPYFPCSVEVFASEAAFLGWLAAPRQSGKAARVAALPVLLDSRGKQMSSTEFAAWLGARRDQGLQHVVFAIGPADGWAETGKAGAAEGMKFSLGPMTMAHELARVVLAEQVYRACTILAGHPYHSGH
jgi:23S rRNA (pseudouridine1915-N3)-methyltransferase